MARARMIGFYAPEEMHEAVDRAAAAAGIPKSLWLRRLVERETGVKADMPTGGAALDDARKVARLRKYRRTITARQTVRKERKK